MAKRYVPGKFSATVDAWCLEQEERMKWIFLEAVQRVISLMQQVGPSKARGGNGTGRMPVDTGFLRASLVVEINNLTAVKTTPPPKVEAFEYNEGQVQMVILAAQLGDSIYAAYTAAYARRLEYGFTGINSKGDEYHQEGYGFVRLATEQWPTIVADVIRDAKAA